MLVIVAATVGIGFSREYQAQQAIAALTARVRTRVTVLRDGATATLSREDIVPGDVVLLSAGSLVPADALLIDATDLFVSESLLTGESFPVEKRAGPVPAGATLTQRTNCVFLGTNVRSGIAKALVVATGSATELGSIAVHLEHEAPETDFDKGIRHFGYLLTSAMLVLVIVVFAAHVFAGRSPVEVLLLTELAVALVVRTRRPSGSFIEGWISPACVGNSSQPFSAARAKLQKFEHFSRARIGTGVANRQGRGVMQQTISAQCGDWVQLIRAEYSEMPGLHLSKRQAQRLWGLDPASCDVIFNLLEASSFLRRTPNDAYIRADIDY